MDDTQQLEQDEQTVTMSIPEGALNPTAMAKQELTELANQATANQGVALPQQDPVVNTPTEGVASYPQQGTVNVGTISTPNPQSPPHLVEVAGNEGTASGQKVVHEGEKPKDPNRDAKGKFIPGNTASVGNEGGRPCEFCKNKDKIMVVVKKYYEKCRKAADGKVAMPFIEEIALDLDINEETGTDWEKKVTPTGELEHPEFARLMSSVRMLQKLRLKQRTLGRYNPTGAMFLLRTSHGQMEVEKKILAGDQDEPLRIEVIEEIPRKTNE